MSAPMAALRDRLISRSGEGLRPGGLNRFLGTLERRTRQDPGSVIEATGQAIRFARGAGDVRAEARLLRARAHGLRAANRYLEALADYRASLWLFRRLKDPLESAIGRIGLVDSLMYLGRYGEAARQALAARRVFDSTGDRIRRARVETNLGNIYHRRDRHAEALEWYERARGEFKRAGDDGALAIVDFNRGNALGYLGRTREARAAYQNARSIFAARGLSSRTGQADYNLAYLEFLENRLPEALESLAAVRPRLLKLGDRRHAALSWLDEAEILLRLNLWDDAAQAATRALAGFEELGMAYETAKARLFLGVAAHRHGDPETARRELDVARRIFGAERNPAWHGETVLALARLEIDAGAWDAALSWAAEARRLLAFQTWSDGAGRASVVRATALRGAGRKAAAEAAVDQALRESRRSRSPWLRAEALEVAGLLALDRGDRDQARRRFLGAIRELERLRSLLAGDDMRVGFFRDRDRPYLALAGLELSRGRPRQAFRILERGRARALLDLLASIGTRRGRGAGRLRRLERQAEELLATLGRHYHLGGLLDDRGRRRAEARLVESGELVADVEARATQVIRRLRRFQDSTAVLPEIDERSIRRSLSPDEAMIVYFEVGGRLGAFRITREEFVTLESLADAGEATRLADRLRFQWGRFRLDPELLTRHADQLQRMVRSDLEQLGRLILAPVLPRGRQRLVLVPTTPLRDIPFGALHDGAGFLVERHAFSVAPSAAVFQACRNRPGRPGGRTVLFARSDRRAPQVAREIEDLRGLFPRARVFTGESATVDAFRREAPGARLIHLATHGVFHSDRPNLSGVRLSDRWLYGYDVARLALQADLVTLSACTTGRSAAWGGGEWLGLARSFLSAGARRVLVGLWEVDDRATRSLMDSFYTRWTPDRTPSAALAEAKAEFAVTGIHPYYWAGFSLVGDL